MDYMKHIRDMHNKFEINGSFSDEEKEFRYQCLLEEVNEFKDATTREDELDALVDIAVFLFGTVDRMAFDDVFYRAYCRVMKSNLDKRVGSNAKRGSYKKDLVKPEGWQAADLTDLV